MGCSSFPSISECEQFEVNGRLKNIVILNLRCFVLKHEKATGWNSSVSSGTFIKQLFSISMVWIAMFYCNFIFKRTNMLIIN